MKSVNLKLLNGHFNIVPGNDFSATDASMPFLCYAENDAWHAVCRPDGGCLYNSEITIPNISLENIDLSAADAAVSASSLSAGVINIGLKNTSADFAHLSARRIKLSIGQGNATATTEPVIAAEFECGSGHMDIWLPKIPRGYFYNIIHGIGTVSINTSAVPRRYCGGTYGGVRINIRCGLGSVNITEY